jgi:hypothetical protein
MGYGRQVVTHVVEEATKHPRREATTAALVNRREEPDARQQAVRAPDVAFEDARPRVNDLMRGLSGSRSPAAITSKNRHTGGGSIVQHKGRYHAQEARAGAWAGGLSDQTSATEKRCEINGPRLFEKSPPRACRL